MSTKLPITICAIALLQLASSQADGSLVGQQVLLDVSPSEDGQGYPSHFPHWKNELGGKFSETAQTQVDYEGSLIIFLDKSTGIADLFSQELLSNFCIALPRPPPIDLLKPPWLEVGEVLALN